MKKLFFNFTLIFLLLILGSSCSKAKEEIRTFPGLIGTYFGNDDFTRIKESEILTKLEQVWDEETGHGGTGSFLWLAGK